MPLFNVALPVIANLHAETPEAATALLADALTIAGFTIYDDPATRTILAPFEADSDTEPDHFPTQTGPCQGTCGGYDRA